MGKVIGVGIAIFLAFVALGALYSRATIEAGYVGVKVNLYGEDRGVQAEELGPGKYWLTINERIYEFPTYTRTDKFDYTNNQSVPMNDIDGTKLQAPIAFSYHIERDKVHSIFQKFRKGIDEISDEFIYNNVKSLLNNEAGKMKVNAIYGNEKEKLLKTVEGQLQKVMEPFGIIIEQLYWTGDIGVPDAIQNAINEKLKADQEQLQKTTQAKTAEALAEANNKLAASITPNLLALRKIENELEAIKKWNGAFPTYMGGAAPMPFINVTPEKGFLSQ